MSVTWTIAGESGAAWNATAVSPAARMVSAGSVTTGSFEQDKLVLTQAMTSATEPPVAPDSMQRVTLYRNGARYFSGWATSVSQSMGSATSWTQSVEVSGPWWWWRKTPMVLSVNHAAFSSYADRNQFVAPFNQNFLTSVAGLVAAYNLRWASGDARRASLAHTTTGYPLHEITLSRTDFLTALSELLKFCPDIMAWWDYSTSANVLRLARRGDATVRTVAMGTDGVVTGATFNPRNDLDGSDGVRIDYALVVGGVDEYRSQSSSGAGANCQVVTVSGPELGGIPVAVTTTTSTSTAVTSTSTVTDNSLVTSFYTSGIDKKDVLLMYAATMPGADWPGYTSLIPSSVPRTVNMDNGSEVTSGTARTMGFADQNVPDWVKEGLRADGKTVINMRATRLMILEIGYHVSLVQTSSYPWGTYYKPSTSKNSSGQYYWVQYAMSEGLWRFCSKASLSEEWRDLTKAPYNKTPGPSSFTNAPFYTGALELSLDYLTMSGDWINRTYTKPKVSVTTSSSGTSTSTSTSISAYQYAQVPSGLAGNLAAAQNWVPYEGSATIVQSAPGDVDFGGCKLVVSNGPPAWASMTALVQSHQVDLFSGRETISCGVPARFATLNLVKRTAASSEANITYL